MIKKRIAEVLTILIFFAVGLWIAYGHRSTDTYALKSYIYQQYQGKFIFYDADSHCYVYQTRQTKRTSQIYYSTVALQFSRIRTGIGDPRCDEPYASDEASMTSSDPHYYTSASASEWNQKDGMARESFYLSSEDAQQYSYDDTTSGKIITTYLFTEEQVMSIIQNNHPDWYAELTSEMEAGNTVYLGVDAIINIYDAGKYGNNNGWSGSVNVDPDGTMNKTGIVYAWSSLNTLLNAEGWSGSARTSIKSCFNSYVPIGGSDSTTELSQDDSSITTGVPASNSSSMWIVKNSFDGTTNTTSDESGEEKTAPHLFTYNTSDVFDLGQAIPTTESYTNGVELDSWYGIAGISKKDVTYEVTARNVSLTVTYPVQRTMVYLDDEPKRGTVTNGDTTWHYETIGSADENGDYRIRVTITTTGSTTYTMTDGYTYTYVASYYRVSYLNLYEFSQAQVTNDASGTVTYSNAANIQYNVTINGENVNSTAGTSFASSSFSAPTYLTTDNHVTLPTFTTSELTYNGTISATSAYTAEEARAYIKSVLDERFEKKSIQTKNDVLQLNGITYLDENNLYMTYAPGNNYYIGRESNDKVTGTKTVTIPEETENGIYYTTLSAAYKKFAAGRGTKTITKEDTQYSKIAILSGYEANEPIVVHSPVIAPIAITGETQTQTVNPVSSTQLLLDGTYTADFNWVRYFAMKGYDNPSGWTKYVKDKQVRFPFSVKINGTYYEPDSSGYTEWISLGNVTSFDFYVPSWAKEGVYGESSYSGYDASANAIEVRVLANNSGGHEIMSEYTFNNDLNYYVAVYQYPVQVSGVIYDFTITGINDELAFGGYSRKTGVYSFVENKEEKRTGTKNRLGTDEVRWILDGTIENAWKQINTLPMINGSSSVYTLSGELEPGHIIGFTLKTISNLYGTDDTIEITPTFRYITADGEVLDSDEFNIYYSTTVNSFVTPGSTQDEADMMATQIGSNYFNGCYFDYGNYDPVAYTAAKYGKTEYEVLNTKTETCCFAWIKLYSTQKLLTGNEEQLAVNVANDTTDCIRYQSAGGLGYLTAAQYDAFESSMQTWYGNYVLPEKIYVARKYPEGSEYEDTLQEYMAINGYVTDDAPCFETLGWLILGFNITTYKDGVYPDLVYNSGTLSMWEREGQTTETVNLVGTTNIDNVVIYPGDVAAIDIGKSLSDRYSIGILYLN